MMTFETETEQRTQLLITQLRAQLECAVQTAQADQHAREQAERELLVLRSAVSRMRDVVLITEADLIDEPGPRITYANPALEKQTGYTSEEVLGRSPRLLQGPKTDRATLDLIRAALRSQAPVRAETLNYTKEGAPYWTDLDIAPVFDAQGRCVNFVALQHDITERRRMEEALRRERDFNASIVQASPTFFVVTDARGRVVLMNPAALTALGYTPDEVIGLPVFGVTFMTGRNRADIIRVYRSIAEQKQSVSYEMHLRTKSGQEILVGWRAIPVLKEDGSVDFVFFTGADISAKRQAEEEKRKAETLLRQTNTVLERRVRERTRELSLLLQASRVVTSTLELEPLLELVLDQLKEVLDYRACLILSARDEDDEQSASDDDAQRVYTFDIISHRNQLSSIAAPPVWHYDLERDLHILPVIEHQAVSIVAETQIDTPMAQSYRAGYQANMGKTPDHIKSWMAVPMVVRNQLFGIMALQSDQPGFYNEQKANLALTFANQTVVAIENARLFAAEQERRAESDRRRQVAEGLSDILDALNSDQSLEETLGVILEQARQLLKAAVSTVYQLQTQQTPPVLKLQVLRGDDSYFTNQQVVPYGDGPISRAIQSKLPVFGNDLTAMMNDMHTPEEASHKKWLHDHFSTLLAVPIFIRDQPYGAFVFGFADRDAISQEDLNLMMVIADQAALAIENAQLRASSAQAAAMAERSRLARELHDSVSQALFGISLGTRTSLELLSSDPSKARDPMDYVLALADAGMAEMRALIFELRPESLQTEGLHAAFHKQASALVARHKINVQTNLSGSEADLPIHVKEAIYRIGLEAIQNTIKHARSTDVVVMLERPPDNSLILRIQDNGAGFDTQGDFPGHFGLKTMRERTESLGGTFGVTSAPGQGTCIYVCIPEVAFRPPKH
jgi:PAS domain S-box-containing protein